MGNTPRSRPDAADRAAALVELGTYLKARHYTFVTVTPLTHQRVLRNRSRPRSPDAPAPDLRDAFGWNLPFAHDLLPLPLLDTLLSAQVVSAQGNNTYLSRVRFSSLGGDVYVHSRYPTDQEDAVFFGPDTYRFAGLIREELAVRPLAEGSRVLDIGCGGGPGGMTAVRAAAGPVQELVLADINSQAVLFSQANVRIAQMDRCMCVGSDLFSQVPEGPFDLIVSNPPYLVDAARRTYRHGGGEWGEGLSQRIVQESIAHLAPGGRLILYTGSAVVRGTDSFTGWAGDVAQRAGCTFLQREIDPDVFGEELDRPEYAGVDRIAAIGIVVQRPVLR
ncbi:methyltransferase [Acidovorax sp.]|uniref:methyltransferase n=1 Tax=Acidovorax sp. TaxID=1872122 RepID=UPI00391CB51D